ncbi:MAG: hypothetical protein WBG42_14830 [Cryomorphaceae bacterium]
MKGIKWFFAEFLVVVTGVLVAFALNSWWMDVKDRNKEETYLKQVLQDIDSSIQLMEGAVKFEVAASYAASQLLRVAYSDSIPSERELNIHALRCMNFEPGSLLQSTLLSLINSGDLQLISDDSTRIELTVLSGELADYETMRKTITTEMLIPAFKELSSSISPMDINLGMLDKEDYAVALSDSLVPLPEMEHFKKPQPTDWEALCRDDEFLDRLTFMYIAHINLQRVHQGALDQLMKSKAKIESLLNQDD